MLLLITRTFFNFLIMSGFISVYFLYLFVYENKKFQETVLNLTHYSIKTYSYIQIYSIKAKNIYLTCFHPSIVCIYNYLSNTVKETDFYKNFKSNFEKLKESQENDSESEYNNNNNEYYSVEIIKDNKSVLICSKDEILNKDENIFKLEYDFVICNLYKNNFVFNKIFYELPTTESDFDFKNIYCDIRSFTILPLNENIEPFDIQFVNDSYYFWVENNEIKKEFLNYFLTVYYHKNLDELKDYQLQIITKDIDIHHLNIHNDDSFKVLEIGIELSLHSDNLETNEESFVNVDLHTNEEEKYEEKEEQYEVEQDEVEQEERSRKKRRTKSSKRKND